MPVSNEGGGQAGSQVWTGVVEGGQHWQEQMKVAVQAIEGGQVTWRVGNTGEQQGRQMGSQSVADK